jgi:hypothetical protein
VLNSVKYRVCRVAVSAFVDGLVSPLLTALVIVAVLLLVGYATVGIYRIVNSRSWTAAALLRRYRQSLPWALGGLVVLGGGFMVLSVIV